MSEKVFSKSTKIALRYSLFCTFGYIVIISIRNAFEIFSSNYLFPPNTQLSWNYLFDIAFRDSVFYVFALAIPATIIGVLISIFLTFLLQKTSLGRKGFIGINYSEPQSQDHKKPKLRWKNRSSD